MAKAKAKAPNEAVLLYEALVASVPGIERKGAAFPYTAVNGNMFSFLRPDGILCLRLPDAERDAFVIKYRSKPVVMHGAVMKEYVAVPDSLFMNTTRLRTYFTSSVAYARSLKPKPTTRTKSS